MSEAKRPRIYLEVLGGNIQDIVVDGEVEIVVVDYDNADVDEFDDNSVDEMMESNIHSGTATEFDAAVAEARKTLDEMAQKNIVNFEP